MKLAIMCEKHEWCLLLVVPMGVFSGRTFNENWKHKTQSGASYSVNNHAKIMQKKTPYSMISFIFVKKSATIQKVVLVTCTPIYELLWNQWYIMKSMKYYEIYEILWNL